MEAVRKKADKLEEAAKRQEKLIQVAKIGATNYDQGNNAEFLRQESVDKTIQVNDMYIEAISAKLKILDSI
jgi:hypothetical protein